MDTLVPAFEKKQIFISRHLSQSSPLQQLRADGHVVTDEPLIRISRVRFTHTPKTDWIFFSSRNAIHHFFSQNPAISPAAKFGVMSSASAADLENYGIRPAFIGSGADATAIAKDFASRIGNETVLLPQAIDSLQTIQKQLSFSNNCFNLFVYKTTLRTDFNIPDCDILVFTSPSNARAYFDKYRLRAGQEVVAIGSTTHAALREFGVPKAAMPVSFDEHALLEAVRNLSGHLQSNRS